MLRPRDKRFVAVTWRDAQARTGPYSESEIPHKPILITTYGWLLREDEAGVSLAGEYCADDSYRDYNFIIRALIDEVREIRVPEPRRRAPKMGPIVPREGL